MKNERFQLLMSGPEKIVLLKLATEDFSSGAEVLRRLLRLESMRRGYWPPPATTSPELTAQYLSEDNISSPET